MKSLIKYSLLAAFAVSLANAALVTVDNGQLVDDTTLNVTWSANASLFGTIASLNNSTTFVNALINDSNGQIVNGSSTYTLTAADFNLTAGTMDWYGAQAFINYLNKTNYMGYSDWRLPTTSSTATTSDTPPTSSSEMAELFYGELGAVSGDAITDTHNSNYSDFTGFKSDNQNDGLNYYWSGTPGPGRGSAWDFKPWENSQDYDPTSGFFNVLPLMDGQIAAASAAPEPATLWLIGGGILLAGFSKRRPSRR